MPADAARFGVRFDELAFTQDLGHATPAGRQIAQAARQRLERDGADPAEFKRCDPDARDGTSLPNCLKTYLPAPDGRWRMIFEVLKDTATGELVLSFLAFGVGAARSRGFGCGPEYLAGLGVGATCPRQLAAGISRIELVAAVEQILKL